MDIAPDGRYVFAALRGPNNLTGGPTGKGQTQAMADAGGSGGQRNVLGGPLADCSQAPRTGFLRTGCCDAHPQDVGRHLVCAVMTSEFLRFESLSGFTGGAEISSIQFYSDSGTTPVGFGGTFAYSGSGSVYYLTAVPEPGAVAGLLALMFPVAWRGRRGWMRCRSAVEATRVA